MNDNNAINIKNEQEHFSYTPRNHPNPIPIKENNKISSININDILNHKNKFYKKEKQFITRNGIIQCNSFKNNHKDKYNNKKNSNKKNKEIKLKQGKNGKNIFEMKIIEAKKEYQNNGKTKKVMNNNKKNTNNNIKIKEDNKCNKLDSKNETHKENKKDEKDLKENDSNNNNNRPEDIFDYINIDDYNKIEFKDSNCKITNEAIEEVEEAKEVSELRQSSEFYNNVSNLKSSRKELKTCSNRSIVHNKAKNNIKIKSINRCLTLENKDIMRKNKKIISKIKNKKESKKNSLNINVLSSNSLIGNTNKHLKIIPSIHSNNYLDLTINNYKRKNKLLFFIKKNYCSTKSNDCKNNFLCLNSDTINKNSHKAYFKKIPNNCLKENIYNRSKKIKYIKKKDLTHIYRNNDIYEKSSKTMPNLKKKFDNSKIDKNELNEYTLNLNIKSNNFKNEIIKKIKETNYYNEKQILKKLRIDENKKKGKLINRNNNVCHYKYLKDFYT